MPKAQAVRKSAAVLDVGRDRLDGKCAVRYICKRMNEGASHKEITEELGIKMGTLARWIDRYLERRYVIRGQA